MPGQAPLTGAGRGRLAALGLAGLALGGLIACLGVLSGLSAVAFAGRWLALAGLVAYIRSMHDFDTRGVALGDVARGEALFAGKGACTTCHRVNGKGSRVGPDLSDIGAIRAPDSLQQSVLDPNTSVLPINRSVRAVTRDGRVISGRRLNEDTYTVQLIDEQERLLSLDKAGLREYTVVKTSSMPSYKDKLTSEELSDLVAYLHSLRGSR